MMKSGRHAPSNTKGQKMMIRARSLGLMDFQLAIGVMEMSFSRLKLGKGCRSLGTAALMANMPYIRTAHLHV